MSSPEAAFAIPPEVPPRAVLDRLATAETTRELAESAIVRTYLDTFDWRLFRAGLVLVEERNAGRSHLRLVKRDGTPARSVRGRRPAFAADLPKGWLRERLAPILGPRRLLARVVVEGTASGLALIDAEEKTLARVVVENAAAVLPDGPRIELPPIARVEHLRGYGAHAERLQAQLAAMPGLRPLEGCALEQMLRGLGAWPGGDPSRPEVTLHPTTRADQAVRGLLSADLTVVEVNEEGVLADLDVEFLHDHRVACRRSRALLGELGFLLDAEAVAAARDGFRWIGARTGPMRDLDVLLLNLEQRSGSEDLAPFVRAARRLRQRALREVQAALQSKRYRATLDAWRSYLDDAPVPSNGASVAPPIARIARDRVRARVARIAKSGRKLAARTPAEQVHRLRLQAKKLRYLLDAFGSVLSADGAPDVRKRLRRLQNALGRFNDARVEIELIDRIAAEMVAGDENVAAALLAMGRRQAELDAEMQRARKKLARRVARLVSDPEIERLCQEGAE